MGLTVRIVRVRVAGGTLTLTSGGQSRNLTMIQQDSNDEANCWS
jgi:hypothetical protein